MKLKMISFQVKIKKTDSLTCLQSHLSSEFGSLKEQEIYHTNQNGSQTTALHSRVRFK